MWLSAGGAGVCLSAGGRGGRPLVVGILTCWTPDSPSLSSLPPPGPWAPRPPSAVPLPGAECCVRGRRADLSPATPLGSGAGLLLAARPRAPCPTLATLSCPAHGVSSCPCPGQGHVGGCGLEQSGPALGSGGFLSPGPVFSDVCLLRFRLCRVWFCSSD